MITAKEANTLATKCRSIDREEIYKRIHNSSLLGNFNMVYSVPFPTPLRMDEFIEELTAYGYTVRRGGEKTSETLTIEWEKPNSLLPKRDWA
jgi:hypothetical protein